MPRAFDTRAPAALHDPTRTDINFNVGANWNLEQLMLDGLENFFKLIKDGLLNWITELTGIDFQQMVDDWMALCGGLINNTVLAGIVGLGSGEGVVAQLLSGLQHIVDTIFGMFTGNTETGATLASITDLLSSVFDLITSNPLVAAMRSLVGDTGVVIFDIINGALSLFGGLFEIIGDLSNPTKLLADLQQFIDALWNAITGAVGDVGKTLVHLLEGLTGWVETIPVIGDIVKAFTGVVGTLEDLADWVGNLPIIGDIVHAITGILGGSLTDLTAWASDLPSIAQIVEAITGIPGQAISALTNWVATLPTIDELVQLFTGQVGPLADIGTWLTTVPSIEEIAHAITGDINGTLQTISDWVSNIPFVAEIVAALTGTAGPLDDLTAWAAKIPLISEIVRILTGQAGPLEALQGWADSFLTSASGINAANIFGQIEAGLLGLIPASHIADVSPNLLVNGSFDTAASLTGSGVWAWDSSKDHSANNGGSAKIVPHSVQRDLMSDLVAVSANQELTISGWLMWSGVTFAANSTPFRLSLNAYSDSAGRNLTGAPDIAIETSNAASGAWRQLGGTYVVPQGISSVRLRLTVTGAANNGGVWWDDLSMTKTNLIPQDLIHGLGDALAGATSFIQSVIDAIVHALTGIPIIGAGIADILTHLGVLHQTANDAQGAADGVVDDLAALQNTLGNSPEDVLGQIPETIVPGIGAVIDNIMNGIGGLFGEQFTHLDLEHLLMRQSDALIGNTAAIQKLLAQNSSGVTVIDDFNRQSDYLGSNWTVMPQGSTVYYPKGGGGFLTTDGNNLSYSISGNTPQTKLLRWVGPNSVSATNFQNIGVVLATQGQDPFQGQTTYTHLLARISDNGLNYCRAQISAYSGNNDTIQLFYCINGVETRLYVGRLNPVPGAGSSINYLCGMMGSNARTHTVLINNQPVAEITESAAVSLVGDSYRGWGVGMTAGSNWLNFLTLQQATPAKVNIWTARDE